MSSHPPSEAARLQVARRVAIALGLYAFAGGLISFLGWLLDMPRLTDRDGNGISIQPNATLAAMSAGAALVLLLLGRRRTAAVPAILVASIGLATLFEYVSGVNMRIDTLFMFDREWGRVGVLVPGRMGPPGTLSWTLVGCALVLLSLGSPKARGAVPLLGLAVAATAAFSLTGYLFRADILYTLPRLTVITWQTATFLLAVALGLIAMICAVL